MKSQSARIISGGSMLIVALVFSNFLNFVFNAFLGRFLSFEEYGLVTLINTFWYIASIFFSGLGSTVNHRTSFLMGQNSPNAVVYFVKRTRRLALFVGLTISVLWMISSPLIAPYFNVSDVWPVIMFAPIITLGVASAVNKGYLQGSTYFSIMAFITVFEALSKLLCAVFLVSIGRNDLVYVSIPLSALASFLISLWFFIKKGSGIRQGYYPYAFPKRFYTAALISGIATNAFLSIDVLLAKHFLSPEQAGQYAVLSLIGKMIYFFGSLLNGFMITFVSRDVGANRDPRNTFYRLFAATSFFVLVGFVFLGPLGEFIVPVLLGDKARAIIPYLTLYTLAIALFTLSNTVVLYRLARQEYIFPIAALFTSAITIIAINFNHSSIDALVKVMLFSGLVSLIVQFALHFIKEQGRFVLRNFVDLMDLFYPLEQQDAPPKGKKRILIFNWRDTQHTFAGGAEVYLHELGKRWIAEGHSVTLFCGNDGKSKRYEVVDGMEVVRRGGFYFVYLWAFLYYLLKFRGRYDLVIDTQNGIPFFTSLYVKEPVYCLMFHVHQDVFRHSLIGPLAWFASLLESKLMPWAYNSTKFITISESSKSEISALGLGKKGIEIVYPGIDIHSFTPAEKSDVPTVLYVGRLKQYKSVDVLIKAAKRIVETVPDAQFWIAGDGEERTVLQKLANKLGIEEKIKFFGKVSEEEKINLYQKAWVFVNPSFMEGWGITTIEANACGTPVVASDVPGLRDSVHNPHTGYLVKHNDTKGFADRISRLLMNDAERAKMSGEAVKWAKRFDWQASAKKCLEVIG